MVKKDRLVYELVLLQMCDFVWQRLLGCTYPLETDCVYRVILTGCILCVTITLIVYCHRGTQVITGGTAAGRFTNCIESTGKMGFMTILARVIISNNVLDEVDN